MSSLKTETLSNLAGTKTIPVDRVASGVAAAWVNFDGTGTVAIRGSYNVSSITDNGVGDYTVNFATALADANYSVQCSSKNNNTTTFSRFYQTQPCGYATTSVRILTGGPTSGSVTDGVTIDAAFVNVAVFR